VLVNEQRAEWAIAVLARAARYFNRSAQVL